MEDIQQARVYIQEANYIAARQLLSKVLKTNKGNVDAWLLLSFCVSSEEQRDQCILKALTLNPVHPQANKLAKKYGLAIIPERTAWLSTIPHETPSSLPEAPPDEITAALADLDSVLAPVKPAIRKNIEAPERERKKIPTYMTPRRTRFLRRVRVIGLIWGGVMLAVVILIFVTDRLEGFEADQEETRTALEAEAATIYRQNTLDVATVAARATTYAGTETAVAVRTVMIANARLVYIYPNRVENRSRYRSTETITVEYEAGPAGFQGQRIVLRIVKRTEQNILYETESTLTSQDQGYLSAEAPDGGWEAGDYDMQLWVNDMLVFSLEAVIESP